MATTVVNPGVATSAPVNMMDSILADVGDVNTEPQAAAPVVDDETAAEIAAIPGDEEEPAAEPALEGDETAEPEAKVDAAPPEDAEDADKKPEIANLELSRWKKVHSGYKYAQELGKALGVVGDDGKLDVTLLPAIEEVTDMRRAFSDRLAMEQDFTSGDPADAETWVDNWNRFAPQGMTKAAAILPTYLAQNNPEAYQQMAVPVLTRFIDYWYEAAAAETDPEAQKFLINGARAAEWWATGGKNGGTYRDDAEVLKTINGRQQQQPNQAEERAQRAEQELARVNQEKAGQRWANFVNVVNNQISTAVQPDVDRVLGPVSKLYEPRVFKALQNDFQSEYKAEMEKDVEGKRLYSIAVQNAKRSPTAEAAEQVKSLYHSWARRAIRRVAPAFVKEATKNSTVKTVSDERHTQLKKAASKTSPVASGGAAPQRTIMNVEARKPGESAKQYSERLMLQDLQ